MLDEKLARAIDNLLWDAGYIVLHAPLLPEQHPDLLCRYIAPVLSIQDTLQAELDALRQQDQDQDAVEALNAALAAGQGAT